MANINITQLLVTPPTILTTMEAVIGNPFFAGRYFLDRVRGPIGLDAFGVQWSVTVTPPGMGSFIRTDIQFDRDVLEIREVKSDLGGTLVEGERHLTAAQAGRIFFSEFPITRIAVWIYPGCEVNFEWILVL